MRRVFVLAFIFLLALVHAPAQSWSPLKSDLLFMSNKEGNAEIYIQKGETREWVNLTNHPDPDNWPAWSPDGKRVVFQRRTSGSFDLWVVNVHGSNQTQLTNNPDHEYIPSWSPDGRFITFTSWRKEPADTGRAPHIYVMNSDGTGQRRLVAQTVNTSAGAEWSPDGKYIVYSRRLQGEGADIFIAKSDGTDERRVTETDSYNGSPVFSPDGSKITFYFDTGKGAQIVVMNLDGSGRRVLVAEGYNWHPRWSRDGQWITYTAYASDDPKNLEIFAVSVSGSEGALRIAGSPARESESSWNPAQISPYK